MATQSVLDLDRLVDRPTVRINKKEYRLFTIDLLPPIENYQVRKLLKRNDELALKDELSKAEEQELKGLLDKIARIVLDAPDAIHKKLTDRQRVEIVQLFPVPSLILKYAAPTATEQAATGAIPTGATSSPASAASIPEPATPSVS